MKEPLPKDKAIADIIDWLTANGLQCVITTKAPHVHFIPKRRFLPQTNDVADELVE